MNNPLPTISVLLAVGVMLAQPNSVFARDKHKPGTPPPATPSPELVDRIDRVHINDGCMSNDEARAVTALLDKRRQAQDEETKQYELFKFHREVLLAKASSPSITIITGAQDVGGVEEPTSDTTSARVAAGRHASKALQSVAAFAAIAVRDHMNKRDRQAAPDSDVEVPESEAAVKSLDSDGFGKVEVDDAVRQLSTYPAQYFRKLSTEKDLHRLDDLRSRKDMLDFIANEQKAPSMLMLQNPDDDTVLPSGSAHGYDGPSRGYSRWGR